MKQISPAVFVPATARLHFGEPELAELLRVAHDNGLGKSRLLLHGGDPSVTLHQMVIVHLANRYIRPHTNLGCAKSYHMIHGAMLLVFFDDDGEVVEREVMGEPGTNLTLIRRFERAVFHTLMPLTPATVFIETNLGPHHETIYADWAPPPDSPSADGYFSKLCDVCHVEKEEQRAAAIWKNR